MGSSPMLRDTVRGTQPMFKVTNKTGERGENLLLKGVDCESSLLWLWEESPPQLYVCCPSEISRKDTVGFNNKNSFIQNSDSSFMVQGEEQSEVNLEPAHR